MHALYRLGIIAIAAAALGACTVGEDTTTTTTPAPVPSAAPTPAAAPAAEFKTPLVAGTTKTSLVQPSNKGELQQKLNKGVSSSDTRDPFKAIAATLPSVVLPKPQVQPRVTARAPITVRKPAYVPPDPTEAKAVLVRGIVDIGGEQYAILTVPGEPTSIYVKPGQFVAANKVLVKRIETFGTPRVILQQLGIEVARAVGQPAGDAAVAPTAAPVSTSSTTPSAETSAPTTPSGVLLPPAPTVNTPTIVPPAGVPIPGMSTQRG